MIINTDLQYNELCARMNRDAYISTPILRDVHLHPAVNKVLCLMVSFSAKEHYLMSISHMDAPQFLLPDLSKSINPETLAYIHGVDVGTVDDYQPQIVQSTRNLFNTVKDCNRVIPIMAFNNGLRRYHTAILEKVPSLEVNDTYRFVQRGIETLRTIETAGIQVDTEVFVTHFAPHKKAMVDGKVYTQYFPYTATGRPSNRFGGINFAALNKHDGSRAAFVSRFDGGQLVQFDFESYHLRLLAQEMNVSLPTDVPVHTYLARQYYGKQDISQEEYDIAKQATFAILYGQDIEVDIPFFQNVKVLAKSLYKEYSFHGYGVAPKSGRHIHFGGTVEENKVLNYFVQALEYESTIGKLQNVLDYLQNKESRLVMYTYDAILLDGHPDEIHPILEDIPTILDATQYPVRRYVGQNYHELVEIK
jgi:hypothetical protein